MISITLSPTYYAPVCVKTLDADGRLKDCHFDVIFERWTRDQVKDFFERPVKDQSDADLARKVVKGWRGVGDAQGHAVPFSAEALELLLRSIPNAGTEIVNALVQSWNPTKGSTLSAVEKAAEKN